MATFQPVANLFIKDQVKKSYFLEGDAVESWKIWCIDDKKQYVTNTR